MKSRPERWKNNEESCFKVPIRYHIGTIILVYESIPKYSSLMEGPGELRPARSLPRTRWRSPGTDTKASRSLTRGPGGRLEAPGGYLEALGTRAARILV